MEFSRAEQASKQRGVIDELRRFSEQLKTARPRTSSVGSRRDSMRSSDSGATSPNPTALAAKTAAAAAAAATGAAEGAAGPSPAVTPIAALSAPPVAQPAPASDAAAPVAAPAAEAPKKSKFKFNLQQLNEFVPVRCSPLATAVTSLLALTSLCVPGSGTRCRCAAGCCCAADARSAATATAAPRVCACADDGRAASVGHDGRRDGATHGRGRRRPARQLCVPGPEVSW
jgi:hypothetical protein